MFTMLAPSPLHDNPVMILWEYGSNPVRWISWGVLYGTDTLTNISSRTRSYGFWELIQVSGQLSNTGDWS